VAASELSFETLASTLLASLLRSLPREESDDLAFSRVSSPSFWSFLAWPGTCSLMVAETFAASAIDRQAWSVTTPSRSGAGTASHESLHTFELLLSNLRVTTFGVC
jgi:hypothetical protein